MDEKKSLTGQFEPDRGRLRAVAYRMLGSRSEAEDAVQEAWLRLARIDTSDVGNLGGWLTTVVARVCLYGRLPTIPVLGILRVEGPGF